MGSGRYQSYNGEYDSYQPYHRRPSHPDHPSRNDRSSSRPPPTKSARDHPVRGVSDMGPNQNQNEAQQRDSRMAVATGDSRSPKRRASQSPAGGPRKQMRSEPTQPTVTTNVANDDRSRQSSVSKPPNEPNHTGNGVASLRTLGTETLDKNARGYVQSPGSLTGTRDGMSSGRSTPQHNPSRLVNDVTMADQDQEASSILKVLQGLVSVNADASEIQVRLKQAELRLARVKKDFTSSNNHFRSFPVLRERKQAAVDAAQKDLERLKTEAEELRISRLPHMQYIAKTLEESTRPRQPIISPDDFISRAAFDAFRKDFEALKRQQEVTAKENEALKRQQEATAKEYEAIKRQQEATTKEYQAGKIKHEIAVKQYDASKQRQEGLAKDYRFIKQETETMKQEYAALKEEQMLMKTNFTELSEALDELKKQPAQTTTVTMGVDNDLNTKVADLELKLVSTTDESKERIEEMLNQVAAYITDEITPLQTNIQALEESKEKLLTSISDLQAAESSRNENVNKAVANINAQRNGLQTLIDSKASAASLENLRGAILRAISSKVSQEDLNKLQETLQGAIHANPPALVPEVQQTLEKLTADTHSLDMEVKKLRDVNGDVTTLKSLKQDLQKIKDQCLQLLPQMQQTAAGQVPRVATPARPNQSPHLQNGRVPSPVVNGVAHSPAPGQAAGHGHGPPLQAYATTVQSTVDVAFVNKLAEQVNALTLALNQLKGRYDNLTTDVLARQMLDQLKTVWTPSAEYQASLTDVRGQLKQLEGVVRLMRKDQVEGLEAVRKATAEVQGGGGPGGGDVLVSLRSDVEKLKKEIGDEGTIGKALAEVQGEIDGFEQALGGMRKIVTKRGMDDLEMRLKRCEAQTKKLETGFGSSDEFSALQNTVNGLITTVDGHDQKIEVLNSMKGAFARLQVDFSHIRGRIGRTAGKVEEHEKYILG